jgi:hypothetical protein
LRRLAQAGIRRYSMIAVIGAMILAGTATVLTPALEVEVAVRHCSLGDRVRFVMTNVGSETLILPSDAPWRIRRGNHDVYYPVASPTLTELRAGDSIGGVWEQVDMEGAPCLPGRYTVQAIFYDTAFNRFTASDWFIVRPN